MNPLNLKSVFSSTVMTMFFTVFVCIISFSSFSVAAESSASTPTAEGQLPDNYSESQVDTIMAGLDDAQVRQMLIAELKKDAKQLDGEVNTNKNKRLGAKLAKWLGKMEGESDGVEDRLAELREYLPYVIPNIIAVFAKAVPAKYSISVVLYIFYILLIIGAGLIIETLFERRMANKYFSINIHELPEMGGPARLISGFMRILPHLVGVFLFVISSYLIFYLIFDVDYAPARLLFLAFLIYAILVRLIIIMSQLMCSPEVPNFRFIPLSQEGARSLHKGITIFGSYFLAVLLFIIAIRALGGNEKTVIAVQLVSATLLIATTMVLVLVYRKKITNYILESDDNQGYTSWAQKGFASIWHILAIIYLFLILVLLLNDFSYVDHSPGKGAFLLSFFIVPVWFIINGLGQWVVKNAMSTLQLHQSEHQDDGKEVTEEELKDREDGRRLYIKISNGTKIIVTVAVGLWLAHLWGFYLPYLSDLAATFFDTLIILTVALLTWKVISGWIERKINESLPEEEEEEEDDGEWGGAANRGRSYTLLPMIRKFIGTVLIVMVTLTILSSMGVDIGPLLAGAGVIGLAIGFGAQKLVSDVFSGFFYLLDDAFRVGEYLTAGSVSGTVESITLRNVMLRHHRGMLQIVPHSQLGAITNFMRGGIVVKFNLDFPYDADIDKIRKIIKKVGQAMLEDETYGKDFIRPVKSQGVREITNSVMTIRAKFTAQSGTHFVIRREAYRLITEALAAKGINYAHRKVIVDIPQPAVTAGGDGQAVNPAQAEQLKSAAGAAALATIQQEEEALKAKQSPKDDQP